MAIAGFSVRIGEFPRIHDMRKLYRPGSLRGRVPVSSRAGSSAKPMVSSHLPICPLIPDFRTMLNNSRLMQGNIEFGVRLRERPAGEAKKVFSQIINSDLLGKI